MKTFLTLAVLGASTFSLSAHAGLESFYGKPVQRGHVYKCVYENTTGSAQSMKYVVFNFDHVSGDNAPYDIQERIDTVVQDGDTVAASVSHAQGRINHCKYLARR